MEWSDHHSGPTEDTHIFGELPGAFVENRPLAGDPEPHSEPQGFKPRRRRPGVRLQGLQGSGRAHFYMCFDTVNLGIVFSNLLSFC